MTNSMADRRAHDKRGHGARRWLWIILAVVVVGGVGFVLMASVRQFGMVLGEEFSPDSFSRRRFYYYEIPLLRIQVTPTYRQKMSSDLENYLRRRRCIPRPRPGASRWDLVAIWKWKSQGLTCVYSDDAAILCKYLDLYEGDELRLLAWTKKYPKLAKVFWPAVAEAAREGLYCFAPDLIDATLAAPVDAKSPTAVEQFQQQVSRVLADNYVRRADIHRNLDEYDKAIKLYTDALRHDPNRAEALDGRADCYEATGRKEKARRDRAGGDAA